jgi:hypothetical protein
MIMQEEITNLFNEYFSEIGDQVNSKSVLNWIKTGIELMVCSAHAYV